ncbi:MAG: polysaccharide pyruvyl transferase family protein [Pseudomonadota bacterium]
MKILLTGTYSSFNKGDAAMELSADAAFRRIAEADGGADGPVTVEILAPFPERDGPFYAPTPVADCDRRRLIGASFGLVRALLYRLLGRRPRALLNRSHRATEAADLVVDLSGDMLTDAHGPHISISHYIPILRGFILGKPVFICAQSIGPFRATRPLARRILNRAAAVTVRDRISLDYLRGIGVTSAALEETADMAFLLPAAPPARAAALLAAEGILPEGGEDVLGVSVSGLVADRFDRHAGARGAFVALMAEALGRVAADHGLRLRFTPHVTGPKPDKDDRITSRAVRDALPDPAIAEVIEADLRPEEMKAIIAQSTVFVGTRMHANIAALSSHVPTVAIAYSHKTPGIMAGCGVEEFVIAAEALTVERLVERLEAALAARAELSARLKRTVAAQAATAARNVEIAARLIGAGGPP